MDRGIAKLLALPFFDEEFRRLVDALSFHTVEKIICVQAQCGPAFADKVMELAQGLVRRAPDGSPDLVELALIAHRFDQFDLFWHLVYESKDLLLFQEARMLGFSAFGRRELSVSREHLQEVAPGSKDFWMFELNDLHSLGDGPITYQRSLKVLRSLLLLAVGEVVKLEAIKGVDFEKLKALINDITWHSAKVTMISASVHAGENPVTVSIQAHHKDTGLVEKYTRSRSAISLQMIQRVTKQIRDEWRPLVPPAAGSTAAPLLDDDFSENEVGEPEVPLFFVRMSTLNVTTKRILSQKFHVTAAGNPSAIACGLVEINDCEALGSVLPDVELLCKRCKNARQDLTF